MKLNTFGLLFYEKDAYFHVDLLPLNEKLHYDFSNSVYNYVLFFERVLIEEDDIEYALDVLNLFKLTKDRYLRFTENVAKDVQEVLRFLENEFNNPKANYQIIKSLLKVLLLHLIRFQKTQLIFQDLKQNRVYQFLNLMEIHYKSETKATFYADKLGIGEKRLNQILKEKLQHTAIQIIKQRQITEIKRELQKKDKSIKEIAYDYNFSSVSAFSRFFKQNVNVSPKDFNLWS